MLRRALCTPFKRARGHWTVVPPQTLTVQSSHFSTRLTDPDELLSSVDAFVFDCDGVIWKGEHVIDGAREAIAKLRKLGKRVWFVTNNSTRSRQGYKAKFDSLNLGVEAEEIFSSSFAAAAYLEATDFQSTGKKVYVIGEAGICEELALVGIPTIGGEEHKGVDDCGRHPDDKVEQDPDVGAVVVGLDRNLNYFKLQYAQLCINQNPGCEFIATNTDPVGHFTHTQEWCGAGTMVGAIKGCTGREPTVVGKPSPLMVDYISNKFGISPSRMCMVGDRLDTDMKFGLSNGMVTCLTLSGVTSMQRMQDPANEIIPRFYVDSIKGLL